MEQIKTHEELKKAFFETKEKLYMDGVSFDNEELDIMASGIVSFPMAGKEELEEKELEELMPLVLNLVHSE